MNVLVTGSSGYLGGWVCEYLKRIGHTLITPSSTFKEDGSIGCNPRLLGAVIHLGWRSKAGSEEPELQIKSLENTVSLVRQLTNKEKGEQEYTYMPRVRALPLKCKLVFASTCSVYGRIEESIHPACPFNERDRLYPNCSYTWAKVAAEEYIKCFMKERSCILRLGSLMGVGVDLPSGQGLHHHPATTLTSSRGFTTKLDVVVNAFAHDAYRKGVVECWHPDAWKPLLHVRDAARIIVEGIERSDMVGTYNAASCCMQARSIAQLAAHLSKAEVRIVEPPPTKRESPRSARVDTSKLDRELPGMQYRTVEEAIKEFS